MDEMRRKREERKLQRQRVMEARRSARGQGPMKLGTKMAPTNPPFQFTANVQLQLTYPDIGYQASQSEDIKRCMKMFEGLMISECAHKCPNV